MAAKKDHVLDMDIVLANIRENLPQVTCEVIQSRLAEADRLEKEVAKLTKALEKAEAAKGLALQERDDIMSQSLDKNKTINRLKNDLLDQNEFLQREQALAEEHRILAMERTHFEETKELMLTMYRIPFQNRTLRESTIAPMVVPGTTEVYRDGTHRSVPQDSVEAMETTKVTTEE